MQHIMLSDEITIEETGKLWYTIKGTISIGNLNSTRKELTFMNLEYVHKILNKKILENKNIVKICLDDFELSIQDTCDFIQSAKKELTKEGYKIYSSGEKYLFKNKTYKVQNGEIIVAIK